MERGSEARPLRVAIVGAGPSGLYTAAELLKREPPTEVDVFDRLPAPYGLVRYGVAPDHQKIKSVTRVFERVLDDPRVRFFGHVAFGPDLSRADLLRLYDQVVYAVGAQGDRRLDIPGEDLEGSVSSTELVNWYNGHPDLADRQFSLEVPGVAVIGIGNVAIDVARILARSADDLATTDIADPAIDAARRSAVRDVWVIARRGPAQAKCTPSELKELARVEGIRVTVRSEDLELDEVSREALEDDRSARRNLDLCREFASAIEDVAPFRRVHLWFLTSPVEIVGHEGRVAALRVERNRLEPRSTGGSRAVGTGAFETLPVGMVVRAVGYRSLPLGDLPYHERWAVVPNERGAVVDPVAGETLPREFVVGWLKRGPTGLIGSNKPDAVETVATMNAELPRLGVLPDRRGEAVTACLMDRGVRWVTFAEWQRLDAVEQARGAASGRPRVKFLRVEEMLAELDRD